MNDGGALALMGLGGDNLYENPERHRVNKVLDLFNYARRAKEAYIPGWRQKFEYYNSIDVDIKKRAAHQSKIFVPRPYLIVETKVPRLVSAMYRKDPIYTVLPESADDITRARISQELLTRQWRNQDNPLLERILWIKDACIYGGAIGQSGWEFRQELVTRRFQQPPVIDPVTLQVLFPPEQISQNWEVTVDRPYFKNIDISEMYPDPDATSIENCKFIIRRYRAFKHDLKLMEQLGVYQNIDQIQAGGYLNEFSELDQKQFSLRNVMLRDGGLALSDGTDLYGSRNTVYEPVEILECWWIDGHQRMKTMVANRTQVIQDIPIPYWHGRWPFYLLKDTPLTSEFWGLGEIGPVMDLCMELNDMRNTQGDNRNQFSKAFWIADRNANIDIDELVNMPPGGILNVNGNPAQALRVERPPQLDIMNLGGLQQVDSDIQMTSGANDIAIGMPTRSQIRTATGASVMAESVNTRFSMTALSFMEEERKIGRDWLALNHQFMSQPMVVRILGMDGLNMQDVVASAQDIPHNFDLYVTLGSELQGDKELMKQQKMQLFNLLAMIPGFRVVDYAKEMLIDFNEKNPDRFFEGDFTIPTEMIMQKMGVADNQIYSNYAETMGGFKGGGTQRVTNNGRGDVLQDLNMNGGAGNAAVA